MRSWLKGIARTALAPFARRLYSFSQSLAEADLPQFANSPKNLRIELPRRIFEPHCMHFGDHVSIGPNSLLVAQTHYPTKTMRHPSRPQSLQRFHPRIEIGARVVATGGLTLSALKEIIVEEDVMFAANVFVSDGMHGFEHANEPYKYQRMFRIAPVRIKRGCWIGQNAVILPGVTVGELSIIGANSVVTHDVPPRSIVVGVPARVVKRWDSQAQAWRDVDRDEKVRELASDFR